MNKLVAPLDREFVIAALVGMFLNDRDHSNFVAKYHVTQEEQRRAAIIAIQDLMWRDGGNLTNDVRKLEKNFGITKEEMLNLALEIVRGCLDGEVDDPQRVLYDVMKHYLKDTILLGKSFCYAAGHCKPQIENDNALAFIKDLIRGEEGERLVYDSLHPKLQELCQDAGLEKSRLPRQRVE